MAAAGAPSVGGASGNGVLLPPVTFGMGPGPPLPGPGAVLGEQRIPFGTASAERVLVTIDPRGAPVAVVVVQRLTLTRPGDYTFVVAAPVTGAEPAAGTDSPPGLRQDAVVWAGFSPGHKTLAARLRLRPSAAAAMLPVRIRIGNGSIVVENRTGIDAPVLVGPVVPATVAAALDRTRSAVLGGGRVPDVRVTVPGPVTTSRVVRISAPLLVRGTAGGKAFSRRIGGGYPERFTVRVPDGPLRLVVVPTAPLRMLTPPGSAPTWAEALRRGTVETRGLLQFVATTRLILARSHQYEQYVQNPDTTGPTRIEYVYVSGKAPPARPPAVTAAPGATGDPWTTVAIGIVLLLAAGGVVVLWARS